jgi:glutamyl-tRNA reductase
LVAGEVEWFIRDTAARDMTPLVSVLRCRVEDVRRAELRRWQARLGRLDPGAVALAEEITAGVVAKLLHGPTATLKDSARTARADTYRSVLVELFDLDPAEGTPAGLRASGP